MCFKAFIHLLSMDKFIGRDGNNFCVCNELALECKCIKISIELVQSTRKLIVRGLKNQTKTNYMII